MSGPKTPTKGLAIIWADNLEGGVIARNRLRDKGYVARLIDAREWHRGGRVEACSVLVFCAAGNQPIIEGAYRAAGWDGEVLVLGVDGNPIVDAANTAMSPTAVAQPTRQQVEQDRKNLQIERERLKKAAPEAPKVETLTEQTPPKQEETSNAGDTNG